MLRLISFISVFFFLSTSSLITPDALVWVHSANLSASLDANSGMLFSLNTSSGLSLDARGSDILIGDTSATPTLLNVTVAQCGSNDDGVCVSKWLRVIAQRSNASCCQPYDVLVMMSLLPVQAQTPYLPSSLAWKIDLTSAALLPWRTSIAHALNVTTVAGANISDVRMWAPRGGATTDNAAWEDTLRMTDATHAPLRTQYGSNFLLDDLVGREISSVPAAVLAYASERAGLGLIAALDDALFGVATDVSATGAAITKRYNRLGAGHTVSFTSFLVPLVGADWRPLFAWARGAMPRYFLASSLIAAPMQMAATQKAPPQMQLPPAPPSYIKTGLGLYSCANIQDMNMTQITAAGATHNWDAKFEWPYIGMYLPLGLDPPNSNWASNLGSGEEPNCGDGWRHGQDVNTSFMASVYADAAAKGITTLTYFNLVEYGEDFSCPLPPPSSPIPVNDWMNSSHYAADHMPHSPWPGCPNTGWQNGVDLNPADPDFASFLVAQAQTHVDTLGSSFFGFAIDRFDHTSLWYMNVPTEIDDKLAWCGAPCILLLTGFNAVLQRVASVVYGDGTLGRIITGNFVGAQRIDVLQHIDGIFSEDYQKNGHMQLLMTSGFATTGMPPAMIWTYSAQQVLDYSPNSDAYFAQHLLFHATPFAPVLGNDHSVQPSMDPTGVLQTLYEDWAKLLTSSSGGCWWLVAEPLRAEMAVGIIADSLLLNAYTVGGGCTDPHTAAGNGPVTSVILVAVTSTFTSTHGDAVTLSMADAFEGAAPATCESITPGQTAWTMISVPQVLTNGRWQFGSLTLNRGAIVLRCSRAEAALAR